MSKSHVARIGVVVVLVLFFCLSALVRGQASPNVGKPMPRLTVGEWISPKPVSADELAGRPYVLEFWATWCPPCRTSIPHLVKLASKFQPRGLIMIGLSRDKPDQVAKVKSFYAEYKMNYLVAMDAGMGDKLPMRGIPHAFVVDQTGLISWAGHPMDPQFEPAVKKVLDEWVIRLEDFPKLKPLAISILRKGGKEAIASLLKQTRDPDNADEAKKLLKAVRKLAKMQLDAAFERAQKMPTEAVKVLDDIASKYEGIEEASEAAAKAREIRADPGLADEVALVNGMKQILQSHQKELQAGLANVRDQKTALKAALPIFKKAQERLTELIKKYPKAKAAARAREELKKIAQTTQRIETLLSGK